MGYTIMTNRVVWRLTTLALTLLVVLPKMITAQESGVANAKGIEFFENKIRPVLNKYCYECHSSQSKKVRGGLLGRLQRRPPRGWR